MPRYSFVGHATVRDHVARCLEPLGWERVDDVAKADIAFTYCTSLTELEDAYFDEEGLVKRAKPATLLVDLSAATPSLARELSAVATVNDLRPVEAPLSVVDATLPDAFASPANLICFVAGEPDDVDEVIDVLETIAGLVERTGASGTAQLAKVAHTVQVAAHIVGAIEAEALVREAASSISLDQAQGLAHPISPLSQHTMEAIAADSLDGTYTVELFFSEVAAAMSAAAEAKIIVPQLEAVMRLLEVLAVIGGMDKPPAALSLIYREEQASAAHGLDWTRAEGLFADHDHDYDDDIEYGYDDDDFGFPGGFGYSAN